MQPQAIILTHGLLGKVLLEAAELSLGPQTGVDVLSNTGLSLEQMVEAVEKRIATDSPTIFFVDYCGGSPFVACATLRQLHPTHTLISGINLPMLISFFTKRDKFPFEELVQIVESDAHRGIQRISA
jgi:mannose/fructose-specific phosphotransferase system component IIA